MSGLFKFVACDASVLGSILSLFLGRPFLGPICVDSATSSLAFFKLKVGIRLNSNALNAFKVLNALLAWLKLSSRLLLERKVSLPFRIYSVGVNSTTFLSSKFENVDSRFRSV